jgi:hypothetical protein
MSTAASTLDISPNFANLVRLRIKARLDAHPVSRGLAYFSDTSAQGM